MKPVSEAELAEIVTSAKGSFEIIGGGTRQIGRTEGDPLHTSGLSGISLYEPEALTLVAQAGTPLAEIETLLAENGQRLPFEPYDLRALQGTTGTPTIGGVVATNASGPRRIQAGACRDSLIGVRFVDGLGRIIKNGGRVMKNVTGYDLVKLLAGSHGTLGVLTEVSFKLLPASEATASVLVQEDEATSAATMAKAMASPYDISGAAHTDGTTALRLEGLEGSVRYRSHVLANLLAGEVAAFDWVAQRDVQAFAGLKGDVWRISVKPSDGPALAEALRRLGAETINFDWAGGLIWANAPEGQDLRKALGTISGHATVIRNTFKKHRSFHPEGAAIEILSSGLRNQFDPRGILNPERL
ncbi:MAG: FAD-binding protein [Rhodobacteraceae bacterium]|nr:FAD-binding protein [Paracoccaceae bacterium]